LEKLFYGPSSENAKRVIGFLKRPLEAESAYTVIMTKNPRMAFIAKPHMREMGRVRDESLVSSAKRLDIFDRKDGGPVFTHMD
jgi:hypothetical protein